MENKGHKMGLSKKKKNRQSVECCHWSGRPGFNPRSSYTKDFKNGT